VRGLGNELGNERNEGLDVALMWYDTFRCLCDCPFLRTFAMRLFAIRSFAIRPFARSFHSQFVP
jgi:hypothetical protein